MTNSEVSSAKPSAPIHKGWSIAFAIISFLGFLDASYLATEHYFGLPISCPLFGNCEKVLTSPYAVVAGISVALLGAVFYLAIFVLAIAYLDTGQRLVLRILAILTFLGFFASLIFLYLQIFIIGEVCIYCLASAIISTLLFILGQVALRKLKEP